MAETKQDAEALISQFQLERILNQGKSRLEESLHMENVVRAPFFLFKSLLILEYTIYTPPDQAGRRTSIVGTINFKPALLIIERAPFPSSDTYMAAIPITLAKLRNLGANDIYRWYMARSGASEERVTQEGIDFFADLKINLIYPCEEAHIKKYSKQGARFVTETPEIYQKFVRPYMEKKRGQGRLNWVYNIIEGKTEVEDVIFRTKLGEAGDEGFLLLPDLNWDRKTIEGLHLLGIVERRDIWSLRDLKKKHIPWLEHMKQRIVTATVGAYQEVEADQLKLYVHYQPTYYHFHIHVVHVALEAGATQATGKAVGLESILETLRAMQGDEENGMEKVALGFTLGEASELWKDVFEPLKKNPEPSLGS